MFGVLVESKPVKQRRRGGALFSAVAHVGLVAGAAIATSTVDVAPAPAAPPPPVTYTALPTASEAAPPDASSQRGPVFDLTIPDDPIVVVPPVTVPKTLPPIGPATSFDPRRLFVGSAEALARRSGPAGLSSGDQRRVFTEATVERRAELVDPMRPHYPDALRRAGIGGHVLMRFVIDTAGRVERESVLTVETTDRRFEEAVRDVLPRMRFRPALIDDQPVRMLVEMPFKFEVTR